MQPEGYRVLRTAHDAAKNEQYWILEATKDQHAWVSFAAVFFDADDVEIYSSTGYQQPSRLDKGAKMRLTISLPPAEVLGRSAKAVVKKKA